MSSVYLGVWKVSFVFEFLFLPLTASRCWNHSNLNEATHRQMDRFFGGVNMTCLHLLMHMGTIGHVTTNFPKAQNLVTRANIEKLKGIPFFLFSSADSSVLSPESTERTFEWLRDVLGPETVEREVLEGYGHLDVWMGTRAEVDVYPMVRRRLDKVCRAESCRSVDHGGYVYVSK